MFKWLKDHWIYTIIGAFFGAIVTGAQFWLENDFDQAIMWTIIGALVGAITFSFVEMIRLYDQKRETAATTKHRTDSEAVIPRAYGDPLSPWRPADHLRLLWWLVMKPNYLQTYRKHTSAEHVQHMGAWTASALLWLPLFTSGAAGVLNGSIPLRTALLGALPLLAAFYITCAVGIPQDFITTEQRLGGISLFTIECFVFTVATALTVGIANLPYVNASPLLLILAFNFMLTSGIAVGIADSLWDIRPDEEQKTLTKLANIVSSIHTFTAVVITIGMTTGASLSIVLSHSNLLGSASENILTTAITVAASPVISLALFADLTSSILQRGASAKLSFGRLARWAVLVALILSQIAPLWLIASRGWPLL